MGERGVRGWGGSVDGSSKELLGRERLDGDPLRGCTTPLGGGGLIGRGLL